MPDLIERIFLERETISFLKWELELLPKKIAELLTAVGDSLGIGCVWLYEDPGKGFAYIFPLTVEISIEKDHHSIKLTAKVKARGVLLDELTSIPCLMPKTVANRTETEKANARPY